MRLTSFKPATKPADEAALESALARVKAEAEREEPAITEEQREQRRENRKLSKEIVLSRLTQINGAITHASIVGDWVWVQYNKPPGREVCDSLKELGFHWNRKRSAWQHPCGAFSGHAKADPREKYGVTPVVQQQEKEVKPKARRTRKKAMVGI